MITTPLLLVDKIKDLIENSLSYVKELRKSNSPEEETADEALECHYMQLQGYLARAKDKTVGASSYIERKVTDSKDAE